MITEITLDEETVENKKEAEKTGNYCWKNCCWKNCCWRNCCSK